MASPYRTVQGFVYAGPFEEDVNGKKVRKFMVSMPQQNAEDLKVKVTVWESHRNVNVNIGDWIVCNGKFEIYEGQSKASGEFVTNYSISANTFAVLGHGGGDESKGAQVSGVTIKTREVKKDIDF